MPMCGFIEVQALTRDVVRAAEAATAQIANSIPAHLFKAAFESATDPMVLWSAEHPYRMLYVNPAFCEQTGYSKADALAGDCLLLQDLDRHPDHAAAILGGMRNPYPLPVLLHNHRKDGTTYVSELHITPVRDGAGQTVAFLGVHHAPAVAAAGAPARRAVSA